MKRVCVGMILFALGTTLEGQYVISTFAGGAPIPTPIPAVNASVGYLEDIAIDRAGNLYFASMNAIYKMDSKGLLTRVAGTGLPGYSGDGGPALNARFYEPTGVAVASSGDIYVADTQNYRIRKISPSGIISTIAGHDIPGFTADGALAVDANLGNPFSLAMDASGNLYFSEIYGNQVRKISTAGILTTVAGNGFAGFAGDGGPAINAALFQPEGITVDKAGNLYIADYMNYRVRKVTPSGIISTVAGNGGCCSYVDGVLATKSPMSSPTGVTTDSAGLLYIAQDVKVRKVLADGTITTVAGSGIFGSSGDGGLAVLAQMNLLTTGIAFDSAGNLYFADGLSYCIRRVSAGIITTVAGNGLYNLSGDGGPAAAAQMGWPASLAMDSSGNLYMSDEINPVVRKISPDGIITRFAGTGVNGFSGDGGPATEARISGGGIALDSAGNLYIADRLNGRVRKVNTSGVISTVAGTGETGFSGDGGPAIAAKMIYPAYVAVDRTGNLYISESRLRKVSPAGTITTVAGNGISDFSGDGGPAIKAQLSVGSVAFDPAGNILIADNSNHRIRQISPAGIITTVMGEYPQAFIDNGPAKNAYLYAPCCLVFDNEGNFYFSEVDLNSQVRKVSAAGFVSKFAGNGYRGYSGDGGPPTSAALSFPMGVAPDRDGNVFIADSNNSIIRVVRPVAVKGIMNAASNLAGPIAPGEIVVLTGAGLGRGEVVTGSPNSKGLFDTELAGTTIQFNGTPGPMIYSSANQVAAVVPYSVTGSTVNVTVTNGGQTTTPYSLAVATAAPGIFTSDSTGKGQAAAFNQDGSANGSSSPAKVGDIVVFYVTGEGQTSPNGVDGKPSMGPYPVPQLPVTVMIGGTSITPLYAGEAPGQIAGLMQVNAQVPSGIATGNAVPIFVRVGSVLSQGGVTIAVR